MPSRRAKSENPGKRRLLCALFAGRLFQIGMADGQALPSTRDYPGTQMMLLDGVRAFRAEHYQEALAIFRQIEAEQSPADIGFYLGMALHKLGRHTEALGVFRAAHRAGLREPVADYYQAVSCYRLGLFLRAHKGFSALIGRDAKRSAADAPLLGPRLQQGARSFLSAIEPLLFEAADAGAQHPSRVQRYEAALGQATALPSGSEPEALEWFDEAVQLFMQIPDRQDRLPGLRQSLIKLRQALRGKPAEADVMSLWAQVGA